MRLKEPLLQLAVMSAQLAIELPRDADNGLLVPDVGLSQSSGCHATDGFVRTYNHNLAAFVSGRICGGHAR